MDTLSKKVLIDLERKDLLTREAKSLFGVPSDVLSTVNKILERCPLRSVVVCNNVIFNLVVLQPTNLNVLMKKRDISLQFLL